LSTRDKDDEKFLLKITLQQAAGNALAIAVQSDIVVKMPKLIKVQSA